MQSLTATTPARLGQTQQLATRLAFFIAGFGLAAWAPLVPFVKARTGFDDAGLGLLLLCLGVGSIVAMPLAGALVTRFGCRLVLVVATGLVCATLPLLATLSSAPLIAAALFVFGAGIGSIDCTINIQAVIVERAAGRPMMSGFHGLFSLGGILGAAGVSGLLGAGLTPLAASLVVVAGMVLALFLAMPGLLPGGESGGPPFAIPHGVVLFIGILCFIMFLAEGAALDWSAVFLSQVRGAEPSVAGLAYAAFATTMTAGRLTGDAVVQRLGPINVVVSGAICAAVGLALATLVPSREAALAGYALLGAGCSNIVPILFTAVGRQKVMPESVAIPAITTLGYAGILVGPAAIGLVAHVMSLPAALLIIAALLLGVAASARWLRV